MPDTIRPMVMTDYEAVRPLWESCEGIGLNDADRPGALRRYLARNPGMSFVARDGDSVVGAVLCGHDGRRGYLNHLAVPPAYRRQGIARRRLRTWNGSMSSARWKHKPAGASPSW